MAWVKLDDHFDEHPKLAEVGPLGLALWVAGLAYCNRNLTDGFIPRRIAHSLLSYEGIGVFNGIQGQDVTCEMVTDMLVDARLWEPDGQGYRVHDYLNFQPSREQILANRTANANRQSMWRGKQRDEQGKFSVTNSVTSPTTNISSNTVPVPVPIIMPEPLFNDGASAPSLSPSPQPKREPYTEEQQRFLSKFNAKRFHNYTQVEVIKILMEKYPATFWEAVEWAAERGMALGIAIGAIKKALPNWNKHQSRSNSGGKPAKPPEEIPSLEDANRILCSQGKPEVTQQELEELYGVHR